jgi:hypothetical protein
MRHVVSLIEVDESGGLYMLEQHVYDEAGEAMETAVEIAEEEQVKHGTEVPGEDIEATLDAHGAYDFEGKRNNHFHIFLTRGL